MNTNQPANFLENLTDDAISQLDTEDKSSFIFNEAKERLKAVIEFSNELDKKIHNLLVLITAVFAATVTFYSKTENSKFIITYPFKIKESLLPNTIALTTILFLLALVFSLFNLLKAKKPREYFTIGSSPVDLLGDTKFYSQTIHLMKISVAERYQDRIDVAVENQKYKDRYFEKALYWLKIAFIVALLSIFLRAF